MVTTFTKHENLEKPEETTKKKHEVYNSDLDKLEKGYQIQVRAGEVIAQYAAVYIRNETLPGTAYNATAGVSAVGVSNISAAASGADIFVTVEGVLTNTAWSWQPGRLVYVSATTPGGLTQTPTAQAIGLALSATELWVIPLDRRRTVAVVDRSTADIVISNSSAEASAFAVLLPKHLLGLTNGIRLSAIAKVLNNSSPASAVDLRVRAKYGATTFFDSGSISLSQAVNARGVTLDLLLMAHGAANAQRARGALFIGLPGTVQGVAAQVSPYVAVHDSMTEDSTLDQMFAVTVQFSIANASIVFTLMGLRVEMLP